MTATGANKVKAVPDEKKAKRELLVKGVKALNTPSRATTMQQIDFH